MKPAHSPILHSSFILLNFPVAGSFYYHCDWHASHYVKVMPDQIFDENNFNCEMFGRYSTLVKKTK